MTDQEIEAAAEMLLRAPAYASTVELVEAGRVLAKRLAADRAEREERERLLFKGFVTVVSGDGGPRVQVKFRDLADAHEFHRMLIGVEWNRGEG